ncbi:MAG: cob(I)yrinic acid a,c-diamide adenosyltransferase [Tissierellia bacterium]|nr:cob(I)yrinic acid a,c-diamide adenosyltransferase [Tissierellia bacterium]
MAKIYTKTGDQGDTGLYGGSRIGKDSLRVNTYGKIDTANASLGLAKAHLKNKLYRELLEVCQLKLFEIAAHVASDPQGRAKLSSRIDQKDLALLEGAIDILSQKLEERNFFSVPGQSKESAFLHMARTDVRLAERGLVELSRTEELGANQLKFFNRLSDLLFVLSRAVDELDDEEEKDLGQGGPSRLSWARKLEAACFEKAKEIGVPMAVAISDDKGNLISFGVMDKTLGVSYDLAKDKAYTAALLRMDTEKLRDLTKPGASLYGLEARDRMVVFGGGLPLFKGGKLLGALGVSGGSVQEDRLVAKAGEQAFMEGEIECE